MHLLVALLLQAAWTGPAGGGMLGIREASVLPSGSIIVGAGIDNFDRDPLGLDITELPLRFRVGLGRRVELFGNSIVSRAVVIAQDQPWPPPPADIYLVNGAAAPAGPYRALYWRLPYVGDRSSGLFDMVPGDTTLGFTWQALRQRGIRPATALALSGTIPNSTSSDALEHGANAGRLTSTTALAIQWERRRWSWSGNAGLRFSPRYRPDRVISDEGTGNDWLVPPVIGEWGIGMRFHALPRLSFSAELLGFEPLGARTSTLDGAGSADFLLGVHMAVGRRVCLSAGFRRHLHPPADGTVRATGPLAGSVNLGKGDDATVRSFLRDIGAPDIEPRRDASVLVLGIGPDVALPDGATRVPEAYAYSTMGNDGVVFALSVRIR